MNEIEQILGVGILVLLLFADLLTIVARSGLRNASLMRLLQEQDQNKAAKAINILNLSPRPYAGLHLVQALARLLLIVGTGLLLFRAYVPGNYWTGMGLFLLLGFGLALLEWFAERRAYHNPEVWLIKLASFIRVANWLLTPLISLTLALSGDTRETAEAHGKVTEDELITLVDASEQNGVIEEREREMIRSVVRLGETLAREIMVPRIDTIALDVDVSLTDAVDMLLSTGFSRVPVYQGSVDHIIGLLYAKDLIKLWRNGEHAAQTLRNVQLREPYFVPEAKKVDELLREMQGNRTHMAIVVDEYGGVAGVVTLEDIVEEIFGEIQDEYDENEERPYQILEDGSYLFRGRIDLDDFNELMSARLPVDEADTLGGFLYMRFGHVPGIGEQWQEDNVLLTVADVSDRRIRKVRAQIAPQSSTEPEDAANQ